MNDGRECLRMAVATKAYLIDQGQVFPHAHMIVIWSEDGEAVSMVSELLENTRMMIATFNPPELYLLTAPTENHDELLALLRGRDPATRLH